MSASDPTLSIIIPAFNEAVGIAGFLERLIPIATGAEILLCPGASGDATGEIGERLGVRVIPGGHNRAEQMNAGAQVAQGDLLIFLHADSALEPGATEWLRAHPACLAGAFRHAYDHSHGALRMLSVLHNWRSRIFRVYYGDQAIFCRRELFLDLGGFNETVVFEDLTFSRALRRAGVRPCFAPYTVHVSARKFQALGVWKGIFHVLMTIAGRTWRSPQSLQKSPFFGVYR